MTQCDTMCWTQIERIVFACQCCVKAAIYVYVYGVPWIGTHTQQQWMATTNRSWWCSTNTPWMYEPPAKLDDYMYADRDWWMLRSVMCVSVVRWVSVHAGEMSQEFIARAIRHVNAFQIHSCWWQWAVQFDCFRTNTFQWFFVILSLHFSISLCRSSFLSLPLIPT